MVRPLLVPLQANAFPSDVNLWRAMGDMGLHGITVAEEDGGLGLGYLHHCIAMEARSHLDASSMLNTTSLLSIIPMFAALPSGCAQPECSVSQQHSTRVLMVWHRLCDTAAYIILSEGQAAARLLARTRIA